MTELSLRLLGTPIVALNNDPIEVDTRKAIALITYLAVTQQPHQRSTLAVMFWPDSNQERSRSALRRTLAALKKAIGKVWVSADRTTIGLDWEWADGRLWADVLHLRRLIREIEAIDEQNCAAKLGLLREAAALYRGPFLEGFTLTDSPDFDDWQFFQNEQTRQEIAQVWQNLVACLVQSREFEEAIGYGRQWLALDPLNEKPHQQLMQLYAWAGQRSAALRQYSECERILQEELGLPPQPETTAIYEQIKTNTLPSPTLIHQSPSALVPPSPISTLMRPRHNLPANLNPFVGREREMQAINERLDEPNCRLVTMIGPGGVGKSRLALEVARTRLDRYPHGVYFVPLSEISSASHLITFIADNLHFSFSGRGEPLAQLVDYLRDKQILHVLDNFEHVLEGADVLAEMIRVLPYSTFLVTSQERLNLREEWLFELDAFACPDESHPENSSAFTLFVQRAQQVQSDFNLNGENKRLIRDICRHVGGLALGIELAATWLRLLSPAEIVAQMEQGLDFLTTGLRNVPDRHRSLRAVFEYSWQLLTDEERAAFARLGVFHTPFAMPAAQTIAGLSLPDLLQLADKSLLRSVSDNRYEVPAVLREYALERFAQDERQRQVLDRYGSYYLRLLARREADLKGAKQREAVEEIRIEIENVRRALRWAVEFEQYDLLPQAVVSLCIFYEIRSLYAEGMQIFNSLSIESVPEQVSANVLVARGIFAHRLGEQLKADRYLRDGLGLARRAQDSAVIALALYYLGNVAEAAGEYEQARVWLEESLKLSETTEDRWSAANALNSLALVYFRQGNYEQSHKCNQESLALRRQLGDKRGIAITYHNMASMAALVGNYIEARRLFQESLELYRMQGDNRGIAHTLNNMGYTICLQGEYAEAQPYLEESLGILLEIGDSRSAAHAFQNLGHVAYGLKDYALAFMRYEESHYLFQSVGDRAGTAEVLVNLGNSARQQQRRSEAMRSYQTAIKTAETIGATAIILDALAGVAQLKGSGGAWTAAADLAAFVATHDDTPPTTHKELAASQEAWQNHLPDGWRPSSHDLEAWIETVLAESD